MRPGRVSSSSLENAILAVDLSSHFQPPQAGSSKTFLLAKAKYAFLCHHAAAVCLTASFRASLQTNALAAPA